MNFCWIILCSFLLREQLLSKIVIARTQFLPRADHICFRRRLGALVQPWKTKTSQNWQKMTVFRAPTIENEKADETLGGVNGKTSHQSNTSGQVVHSKNSYRQVGHLRTPRAFRGWDDGCQWHNWAPGSGRARSMWFLFFERAGKSTSNTSLDDISVPTSCFITMLDPVRQPAKTVVACIMVEVTFDGRTTETIGNLFWLSCLILVYVDHRF